MLGLSLLLARPFGTVHCNSYIYLFLNILMEHLMHTLGLNILSNINSKKSYLTPKYRVKSQILESRVVVNKDWSTQPK